MRRALPLLVLVAVAIAACATPGTPTNPPASPTPVTPTAPPSTAPANPAGVVVTIEAGGETYRILLTEPDDIATARALLAGTAAANIPNGKVVRGDPGVNIGYSWHIDPNDIEWAEMTMELCDGKPSDVEANTISGDRFCPWSAKVTAVEDYTG